MGRIIRIIFYTIVVILTIVTVFWLATDVYGGAGFGLNFARLLTIIAALGVVISSVLYMVNSPKNAVKPLIGFGLILLVGVISFFVSPGEVLDEYIEFGIETVNQSKIVDVGIYLTLVLSAAAVVITLVSEGISLFKN
ncbi:hypothetical protein N9811_06365 [Bacteroidia bacterium]|nr:hypothetical protein [Bacteroidia bacterium]MDB4174406.1 hypothetical protein [Bacteroidia bacterium]